MDKGNATVYALGFKEVFGKIFTSGFDACNAFGIEYNLFTDGADYIIVIPARSLLIEIVECFL